MSLLVPIAAVAILVGAAPQGPLTVPSPYLDAVRQYDAGTEAAALAALAALPPLDPDQVLEELDDRVCAAAGAPSCGNVALALAGHFTRVRVVQTWRLIYPRALGLHVDALAACHPQDHASIDRHRRIVLRLIERLEAFGRDAAFPPRFAGYAPLGRHLLVWALQWHRHEGLLAATLVAFQTFRIQDRELWLAHGVLEELRSLPPGTPAERTRHVKAGVLVYESLLADQPDVLEAHLRVARLLLRLDRHEDAEPHLQRVADLRPDARQVYLARLFLADVRERRGDSAGAIAAYRSALEAWPSAQAPWVAIARLQMLGGNGSAHAALAALNVPRRTRSDPWASYMDGQGWRLAEGRTRLKASFEPLP